MDWCWWWIVCGILMISWSNLDVLEGTWFGHHREWRSFELLHVLDVLGWISYWIRQDAIQLWDNWILIKTWVHLDTLIWFWKSIRNERWTQTWKRNKVETCKVTIKILAGTQVETPGLKLRPQGSIWDPILIWVFEKKSNWEP